jgi:hypothetical protein
MAARATEALTSERYDREAGAANARLIGRIDPSLQFFTEAAPARAILFEANYALTEDQFQALMAASRSIGEGDGFYVHMIERAANAVPDQPEDWWIAFDNYETYLTTVPPLENLLHSGQGSWALVMLMDGEVAVGGSRQFLDALLAAWPSYRNDGGIYGPTRQVDAYLDSLALHGRPEAVRKWLPGFLAHMYSEPDATRLLAVYDEALGRHS